jgi:outer membrane protein assembly factor BamB
MPPPALNPSRLRPRWWPAFGILAAAAAALAWVWWSPDDSHQDRNIGTLIVSAAASLLLLLWALLLGRFRLRTRLVIFSAALVLVASAFAILRVDSVSGDLLPRLVWRWSPAAGSLPLPEASVGLSPPSRRAERLTPWDPAWDYPQFQGPERNATIQPQPPLDPEWSRRPPRLLWRRAVGAAWSSFAVQDGLAVTQEQRGEDEAVVAYDIESGEPVWAHAYRARFGHVISGHGPRATPTVSGGRVFTAGATGILNALDLSSGKPIWTRDFLADAQAENKEWGASCSPLVADGLVIASAGGTQGCSLIAYRAEDGERAWCGGGDGASYSSPLVATLAGRRQVVILNKKSVAGHDPADGKVIWEHPWPRTEPSAAQPVVLGDRRLLVSSGYGIGSQLLEIQEQGDGGLGVTVVWQNRNLKSKFANVVARGGSAWGLDDGILVCLDLADGRRRWKGGRYGHGQLLLAGEHLLVQAESGDVALVEASETEHRELGRFEALTSKTWNHPVLSGKKLLVRNAEEAACYELPLAETRK